MIVYALQPEEWEKQIKTKLKQTPVEIPGVRLQVMNLNIERSIERSREKEMRFEKSFPREIWWKEIRKGKQKKN